MKIIFSEKFHDSTYAPDGAAAKGRMEAAISELPRDRDFEFVEPSPAKQSELELGHEKSYIEEIKKRPQLFELASLAAGAAIEAGRLGFSGEPTFAAVRPPGHHAHKDSSWGYCYFGNLALAILSLINSGKINTAFVLDFDAHTGDGTIELLAGRSGVEILNPFEHEREKYIKLVESELNSLRNVDIFAVSAGFDSYEKDLGKKLKTFDFYQIGYLIKKASKRLCEGRRFASLEGGYYLPDLGKNVSAFCGGFK